MDGEDYSPRQEGIAKDFKTSVSYYEFEPPKRLSSVVYRLWVLKSQGVLTKDFEYVVMPDACVDIVFNAKTQDSALIMTPHVGIEKINLGNDFHYVGIRLNPGVLSIESLKLADVVGHQVQVSDLGSIELASYCKRIYIANDKVAAQTLRKLLDEMVRLGYLKQNRIISSVLLGFQYGLSLDTIASKVGYSTRQLRRIVHEQTGFTPVQLYRIFRFQAALSSGGDMLRFADQSHMIKEFRRITGTTFRSFTDSF